MIQKATPASFPPGSTIGMLGGGQLGRMFAFAARAMGYRVHVFTPEPHSPAGQVADAETIAAFGDSEALRAFADRIDVATIEFENIPVEAIVALSEYVPVRPDGDILGICQHRVREKAFLSAHGFPVTPFAEINRPAQVANAIKSVGFPAILKTAHAGYDGKGQTRVASLHELSDVLAGVGTHEMILEKAVDLAMELSVIVARGVDGQMANWGVFANRHERHVLDVSVAPAGICPDLTHEAIKIATEIARQLKLVGVLCVEFFLDRAGRLLVNELAPRPHNSGHLTIEAFVTSQFEQQVRAVCGLPLGSTDQVRPAAMANLLGDHWHGNDLDWSQVCSWSDVKFHLYGKAAPRPGRKMGHLTATANTTAEALHRVCAARAALAMAPVQLSACG